jgi:hypothetical protein
MCASFTSLSGYILSISALIVPSASRCATALLLSYVGNAVLTLAAYGTISVGRGVATSSCMCHDHHGKLRSVEDFIKKQRKGVQNIMDFETVMQELEALGKERTKKMYISNGAHEPLFGVATGAMKPIAKKVKINQRLAEELYATGNYDAMYFAGIITDPNAMTKSDYDRWMDEAYFYMLSDYVVAVTLSESNIAQDIADK